MEQIVRKAIMPLKIELRSDVFEELLQSWIGSSIMIDDEIDWEAAAKEWRERFQKAW